MSRVCSSSCSHHSCRSLKYHTGITTQTYSAREDRMEGIITAPLQEPPGPFGNEGFWALKETCTGIFLNLSVLGLFYTKVKVAGCSKQVKSNSHTLTEKEFSPNIKDFKCIKCLLLSIYDFHVHHPAAGRDCKHCSLASTSEITIRR